MNIIILYKTYIFILTFANKTEGDFLMTLHEKLQAERAEGIEQEKIATVIRMAKKNMPLSDIAECTDLSTDEVQKILNTIAK